MTPAEPSALPGPGYWRRLACFLYEGVLLFGVVMVAGYLYGTLTQQRHALQGKTGLQVFLFLVLGIYFVGFWSRGGQTLAMKTWHIRLVMRDGRSLSQGRALLRYLLSWLWFLPSLVVLYLSGVRGVLPAVLVVSTGVLCYAATARFAPDGQYWHDVLLGTRLVDSRPRVQPRDERRGAFGKIGS